MAAQVCLASVALWVVSAISLVASRSQLFLEHVKSPVVMVVGCAGETARSQVWVLSHAGERSESSSAGITTREKEQLAARPLGHATYELIGVADFVDSDKSRAIGVRGQILLASRVNATGVLAQGRKVAVKGLYIESTPPRINLLSAVTLGPGCPSMPGAQLAAPSQSPASPPRTVWDGVYTEAQQQRGDPIYARECSTCHGETLKGGEGSPPLVGADFLARWSGRTVADLFDTIRLTMPAPPEQPGKLRPQENADVVAHILRANGFPAGSRELPSDAGPLRAIRIVVEKEKQEKHGKQEKQASDSPTFNRDVASLLFSHCVTCHRPGEAAPMSLLTYEDARPWARAIKAQVANRRMPPWLADRRFSRPLAHDRSLTDDTIATIVAWVDAGAPRGSGAPPTAPVFADGWHRFKNRPPDAIVDMPMTFDVPAQGVLPVFTLWSPNPFREDKYVEAVELRPSGVAAVHHSDVTARSVPAGTTLGRGRAWKGGPLVDYVPVYPDGRSYNEAGGGEGDDRGRTALARDAFQTTDDNRLLFYVPGGGFQQFPPGAVKRISAGNVLAWGLHYTPAGTPVPDRHRLGLWFAETPHTHEVITKRIGEAHIIEGREFVVENGLDFPTIPPFAPDWKITALTPIQDDVTLYGLWPHMHLRGKDMTFIATYPDGREEVLLHVPQYDFQWQLQYELATPVRLPAGSTIKAIGHYDNSAANKYNPAPDKPVYWSEQSSDEMFNGWMELSVDRHVIAPDAVYTIATPVHGRVSLGIGSGPPGTVYVRHADGSALASGAIGSSPSFIEPWTFVKGQTISTERGGPESGVVTLTVYDVPPDVTRSIAIAGPAVAVTTTQPGQNGTLTFSGTDLQRVTVHVTGNRMREVTVTVLSADAATPLAASTSSAGSFNLAAVTLPSTGRYTIHVDPAGMAIGTLNIAVTATGAP